MISTEPALCRPLPCTREAAGAGQFTEGGAGFRALCLIPKSRSVSVGPVLPFLPAGGQARWAAAPRVGAFFLQGLGCLSHRSL